MTTSTCFRGLIATAIFGVLASGLAAVRAAGDTSDLPQVVVKYGDLNLSRPQGAAVLYSRIAAAARIVCKSFEIDSRSLGSRARMDACVHNAMADAVTAVDQPQLSAIYNSKNGTQPPTVLVSRNR